MIKLLALMAIAVPLLAACETSDWMADPDESYAPSYTASDAPDPSATDPVIEHSQAVNRQNCADYYAGHNVICNE